MKHTFKHFINLFENKNIIHLTSVTEEHIGKKFKLYDTRFRSRIVILKDGQRADSITSVNDLEHKQYDIFSKHKYAFPVQGTVVTLVDFQDHRTHMLLLIRPDNVDPHKLNGQTFAADGNTRIKINLNDKLLALDVYSPDDGYLVQLDNQNELSAQESDDLIDRSFYGRYAQADAAKYITFDEHTKTKTFFGDISVTNTGIKSLNGAPKELVGTLRAGENDLRDLSGCPQRITYDSTFPALSVHNNPNLSSFGNISLVVDNGSIKLSNCGFTSLKDIHKHIKQANSIDFGGCPIRSHVLGLLLIKNLKDVTLNNEKVQVIINKYLPEGDIFECQEELVQAGFDEFAQI